MAGPMHKSELWRTIDAAICSAPAAASSAAIVEVGEDGETASTVSLQELWCQVRVGHCVWW